MKINLTYHKLVKVTKYADNSVIEIPDKFVVRALLTMLEIPKDKWDATLVYVNNEPVWGTRMLKEGDTVKLLPFVSGG